MALADLGSGQGAVEEAVSELCHRRPLLGGAAFDPLRGPECVGGKLLRVVGDISRTASPWLAGMELDQLSPVEDPHKFAVQADLHHLARGAQGRRHRIEGVLADHMVVGMDFGHSPVGDLLAYPIPGRQGLTLLVLQDLKGLTPSAAMNPLSGHIPVPTGCFIPEVD